MVDPGQTRPSERPARDERTKALIEGYLTGTDRDGRRLFESQRQSLLRHARTRGVAAGLGYDITVEDVVAETLVRALESGVLERFEDRGPGSLRNTLLRVMDRVVVDLRRRRGALKRGGGHRAGAITGEARAARLAASDPTPTSLARTDELLQLCRARLSPDEWEIWHLTVVGGIDSHGVAARVGSTPAAVRGVMHRVRAKLVRWLAGAPDGDSPI